MSLTDSDVQKIARLARLAIDGDARASLARDLSSILELVEQMDRADTGGIAPLAHPLDATARLRPDEVTETDQRETFQSIAPRTEAGLYLVPKVIE